MAIERNEPPMRKNRRPRIYFASQIAGSPPTIVLKCNDSTLLDESWKRYLLGFLREATPFREVPIRLVLRSRHETDPNLLSSTAPENDDAEPLDIMELSDEELDDSELVSDADQDQLVAGNLLMIDDDADFEEDPDYPAPNFIDDDPV
jgi:GTP-binding protein